MIRILATLLIYIIAVGLFPALAEQPCAVLSRESWKPDIVTALPDSILRQADAFVLGRLGETFYTDNVLHLESLTGRQRSGKWVYRVSYSLRFREEDWARVQAVVLVDSSGNCECSSSYLVPDCENDPSGCEVAISPSMACRIACDEGLDSERCELGLQLKSSQFHQGYIWEVLYVDDVQNGLSGVWINSYSGEVVDTLETFLIE